MGRTQKYAKNSNTKNLSAGVVGGWFVGFPKSLLITEQINHTYKIPKDSAKQSLQEMNVLILRIG